MTRAAPAATGAPFVTVLMAVHDGERYLQEAIDSVLAQDFADFEFVIVDDASRDGSPALLAGAARRDARIRVLTLPENVGLTRALNLGLKVARGTWIARIDADDRCHPDRLSRQVAAVRARPDTAILGSGYRLIDGAGRSLGRERGGLDDWQARWLAGFTPPAPHPTFFYRRISNDGLPVEYDETFVTAQDFDLWTRLSRIGPVQVIEAVLIDYRRHEGAITVRKRRAQATNVAAISTATRRAVLPAPVTAALAPLDDLLTYRTEAWGRHVDAAVAAMDTLLAHDLPTAPSPRHRRWMRDTAAGILADAVLARGGALRRPPDLLRFVIRARHLLLPLASITLQRGATARKVLRTAFQAPPALQRER